MLFEIYFLIFTICIRVLCDVKLIPGYKHSQAVETDSFRSCFESLGCLDTNESWFDPHLRPVNLEPLDRHIIKTEFVFIKNCFNSSELIYDIITKKKEVLVTSGFQKGKRIKFLIHDFTSNGYTGWIKNFVGALPKPLKYNVISVDWQSGAEPPFEQAIANARVVALEIVAFIQTLTEYFNIHQNCIHLIGHGVGAHIAGYVGKIMSPIRKITGLDPTGPHFAGMPNVVKLTHYDANYVEVIHTDAYNSRSQGTMEPMGHADFYINGALIQPSCNQITTYPIFTKLTRDDIKQGIILPACSHKRAFKYYIESIDSNECQFLGIKCPNYEVFKQGKCVSCVAANGKSLCATFGLRAIHGKTAGNQYFLDTRGQYPFCMLTYKVEVVIKLESKTRKGKFDMIFIGETDQVTNASSFINAHDQTFVGGFNYTFIYYASPPKLEKIKMAKVKWKAKPGICFFCKNIIKVKQIVVELLILGQHATYENVLCPTTEDGELATDSYVNFKLCKGSGEQLYQKRSKT